MHAVAIGMFCPVTIKVKTIKTITLHHLSVPGIQMAGKKDSLINFLTFSLRLENKCQALAGVLTVLFCC